ncbi:MAG: pyridoxal phosphate enzyme, YggS family [SAR86 cluster bacterium SAR86B]|jgi:pyridoxal phosphate enzyme (YggS family)|uniref:Pyridoxal phosphate homeostasis protein n=1 Tax=SAR86 cluster bacterium SAR86B TaxID=1123867 RepID=J5KR85_9GAMM|nr:MAG: pyridoxal phosphate enzyme, YggS family [SAR86 cluster bacterium SAR86B]
MQGQTIKKNIATLHAEIDTIKSKYNIKKEVAIIPVSKRKSVAQIREAYDLGFREFGENYAQELSEKASDLPNVDFHFIGAIQSNKIKTIAKNASWVHTIDRFKVAKILDAECKKLNKIINILIQINISNEPSKNGIALIELDDFIEDISIFKNLKIKGIMVLPDISVSHEAQKETMLLARKTLDKIEKMHPDAGCLSMGTTQDYKLAIECGSNMIRIGESIFGKRT